MRISGPGQRLRHSGRSRAGRALPFGAPSARGRGSLAPTFADVEWPGETHPLRTTSAPAGAWSENARAPAFGPALASSPGASGWLLDREVRVLDGAVLELHDQLATGTGPGLLRLPDVGESDAVAVGVRGPVPHAIPRAGEFLSTPRRRLLPRSASPARGCHPLQAA